MNNQIKQNYQVDDSNEISLGIVIGEQQAGWFAVFLDGNYVVDGKTKIENLSLGMGSEVRAKSLTITSTVIDINPNTNRTAVTYFLKGGKAPLEITSKVTVENDNHPAFYDAEFKFV